eukprot:724127_1
MGNVLNTIKINVEIKGDVEDKFVIHSVYGKNQKMKKIFNKIIHHLNTKYDPVKYEIGWINSGFTGHIYSDDITDLENKSITEYDRKEIKTKGLRVEVQVQYNHEVHNVSISCPEMKRLDTTNP